MQTKNTHSTKNNLSADTRQKSAALLNQALADLTDLYSQTKQAHWSVRGPDFYSLHKLFDDLAGMVEPHVDTVAERITALGGTAQGTVRQAAAHSALPEFPATLAAGADFVSALVERYASVANRVRKAIDESADAGDATSADVFTEISRDLDKALWFLEAHSQ
jgi:starvation-inducible DNA-binding protein